MKAKFAAILIAIALLSSTGLAQAATKMELARQYFDLINFEKTIKTVYNSMALKDMVAAIKEADPGEKLSEAELMEELKKMQDAFTKSEYLKQMKEELIIITADVYNEAELKALVSFYSSKEGKSIINKMPVYAQKTQFKMIQMSIPIVKKMAKEAVEKLKQRKEKKANYKTGKAD